MFSCFHHRSHRINTLLTVYWKYHSSVVVLPLVPTALVAIQQQTHDISQYTVNNIYIYTSVSFADFDDIHDFLLLAQVSA